MIDNMENWICYCCQFENSYRMVNCEMCFGEKLLDHKVLMNIIMEENYYENLPPNLESKLRFKADMLKILLANKEFELYLKEKLTKGEITDDNLNHILTENYVLDDVIDVLKSQCPICINDFPLSNMHEMFSCKCRFCKACITEWLKDMIMNKPPNDWICPQCFGKEMSSINKNVHFLAFRPIIDSDPVLKGLFNDKLRDQQLEANTKFRWCKNEECTNGFEIVDDLQIKVACTACGTFMCTFCNVLWHEDETCDVYNLRILNDDPNFQIIQNRIECPQCKMKYELAKGGCLHFKCKNCALEFCGCCNETYFKKKCDKPNCNLSRCFHAHHPKYCAYYTRDYAVKRLKAILKNNKIDLPKKSRLKRCPIIISDNNFQDINCRNKIYKSKGLCKDHYKEQLCFMICQNHIDIA